MVGHAARFRFTMSSTVFLLSPSRRQFHCSLAALLLCPSIDDNGWLSAPAVFLHFLSFKPWICSAFPSAPSWPDSPAEIHALLSPGSAECKALRRTSPAKWLASWTAPEVRRESQGSRPFVCLKKSFKWRPYRGDLKIRIFTYAKVRSGSIPQTLLAVGA